MRKTETLLHQRFAASRITKLNEKIKPTFRKSVVKIGLSEDPVRRLKEVNQEPYKSGDTEWFYLDRSEITEAKNLIRSNGVTTSNEGTIVRWLLVAAAASLILIFLKPKIVETKEQNNFINVVKKQYDKDKNQRLTKGY
jgi:hypothetical protein